MSGIKFPTSGYIKIDGVPLNFKNVFNWFSKISYVPQKIFLFNDSIKNNLIIHNQKVSNEEIFKILNIVDLDIFSNDHKHLNLDTKISELNNNLSGEKFKD